jgi:hypothetical protein
MSSASLVRPTGYLKLREFTPLSLIVAAAKKVY